MKASAVELPKYAFVRKAARWRTLPREYYGFVAADITVYQRTSVRKLDFS